MNARTQCSSQSPDRKINKKLNASIARTYNKKSHTFCSFQIYLSIIQGKLNIMRSLGPGNLVCYIRYLVISVVNKQCH